MPPKKANPKPAGTEDGASEVVNHKSAYFVQLNAKIEEVGAKGYTLIVGIEAADDEDEEGEQERKEKVYTKEQMDSLRVILVNDRRIAALNKAAKMVNCGQSGCIMMFNTHTGNMTILEVLRFIKAAKAKKTLPERFDCLFGLTYQLERNDVWAQDNEMSGPDGELEEAILGLGKAWSDLLSHSDAELGIDAEYTRPGIEALLDKFAETHNGVLKMTDTALFKWDKYKTAPKKAAAGASQTGTSKSPATASKSDAKKRKASSEDA